MSVMMNIQLCELALRCGDASAAARALEELDQWVAFLGLEALIRRLRAQLAALVGDAATADRWADDVGSGGWAARRWAVLEAGRARGLAALFDRDPGRAVELLWPIWEHTVRENVDDPGAFPVAGDLVEALIETSNLELARRVIEHLRLVSVEQDHPWGRLTARRGAALVRLADSDTFDEVAAQEVHDAAAGYAQLGLHFDYARSLLAVGRVERRFRKNGAARSSLGESAAALERRGCSGWADLARSELARVSGRRRAPNEGLTASEHQVAELAVGGLSNKEIAAKLSLSVYTVEAHLTRAYAKLGVRSRAQLTSVKDKLRDG
jgi:DNA-binding CsgD family transcriptional regulator